MRASAVVGTGRCAHTGAPRAWAARVLVGADAHTDACALARELTAIATELGPRTDQPDDWELCARLSTLDWGLEGTARAERYHVETVELEPRGNLVDTRPECGFYAYRYSKVAWAETTRLLQGLSEPDYDAYPPY